MSGLGPNTHAKVPVRGTVNAGIHDFRSVAVPRRVGIIEQPTAEICVLCEDHMPEPHNFGAARSVHENELCRPVGSLHQVGMLIRHERRGRSCRDIRTTRTRAGSQNCER